MVTTVAEANRLQHGHGSSMPVAEITAEYQYALQQAFSEVFDVELVTEHSAADTEPALTTAIG